MTHFEWPVGSPTRGQICWRKSDNMLSDLKIVESIVKSRSDNMLSDFHGNPTVCCRIWGAHSKWVGAREGRPPSQGASPLSSLKPLTKKHETQFYSKWVNSKWVRVSPISSLVGVRRACALASVLVRAVVFGAGGALIFGLPGPAAARACRSRRQ